MQELYQTIFAGSTSDGKVYRMIICPCGWQSTSGQCEHVKDPLIVEQSPWMWPSETNTP